jgi:PST family polysaccharide transporter
MRTEGRTGTTLAAADRALSRLGPADQRQSVPAAVRSPPLKQSHAVDVFWSGFEAAVAAVLSFASVFIVARLVGPAEVGIGAAAVAVHVLLWVTVNALFADALVQRSVVDDAVFSSALAASTAIGCVAALLQVALGLPLAWSLGDGRLTTMSAVLALSLPLVGAAGPVQGMLTRDRAYRKLAWRTLTGQGFGTLTGVVSALAGAGAWALVAQQLVNSTCGAIALLLRSPMRPRLTVSREILRELLNIGLPLTASTLVQHGRYRLFALLIGATAGAAALGQVHIAFRLVDAVRELAFTAQWRLMLPLLSKQQHDLPALRAGMDRCLGWSSVVAFPLCAVVAVTIEPLVATLLGPVWQPSGMAALPLIALTAWLFLTFPTTVAVIARGEPRTILIANIAGTVATVAGVLLIHPAAPLHAVLVWLGAQACVSPYLLLANAHVLRTTPLRLLRAGVPMLAASLLATVAAFVLPQAIGAPESPAWLLVFRLAIVAAIGIPGALLMIAPIGLFKRASVQR